jgi:glycerol-3-phosphate dehydrogenase
VAELVAQGLTLEADPDFDPRIPFPTRFAEADAGRQAELARRDPRFARMVCRCEWVTEGEIVEAIERGARTLDGIKFRTRAGMGRCQGGFCTWRCMELLEEVAGVPIEGVTKRGGDSWVVLPRQGGAS